MVKGSVREIGTKSKYPKRLFDVIVEDKNVYIELKIKDNIVRVPWQDVVYQVEKLAQGY